MKIKGIRWWMVSLVAAGLIINYLARNTLSVAAATLIKDLNITTAQYSHVVVAWQLCYAFMQPVAGYVLDTVGTKLVLRPSRSPGPWPARRRHGRRTGKALR